MAYSTVNVSINGVATPAIDVSGDQTEVILEEALSNLDKENLNKVSDETGATFQDKLNNTVLDNGVNAGDLYANFIVTVADKDALRKKMSNKRNAASEISTLQADVADHEARITTLEP